MINWATWIPGNFCTFFFVPYQYRPLFINSVSFVWSAMLSKRASSSSSSFSGDVAVNETKKQTE